MAVTIDVNKLHQRFMEGVKLADIALEFDVDMDRIQRTICEERKKNPVIWPYRKKSREGQLFHVYECEDCIITFAVEQAFEDQAILRCPVCCQDGHLRDVGPGEMEVREED